MASYGLESALGTAGAILMRQQERQWKKEDDELAAVRDMDMWEKKQRLLLKLQEEADARTAVTSAIEGDERVWRNKNGDVVNRYKISPDEAEDRKLERDTKREELKSAQNKNDPELFRLTKENISADIDARHASAERDRAAARLSSTGMTPAQERYTTNQISKIDKEFSQALGKMKSMDVDVSGIEKRLSQIRANAGGDPTIQLRMLQDLYNTILEDPDAADVLSTR